MGRVRVHEKKLITVIRTNQEHIVNECGFFNSGMNYVELAFKKFVNCGCNQKNWWLPYLNYTSSIVLTDIRSYKRILERLAMITSFEALALFILLLPGLLGLLIYQNLAESFNGSTFDKALAALVLTILASLIANKFFGIDLLPDLAGKTDTEISDKIKDYLNNVSHVPSVIAAGLAALVAIVQNKGWDYNVWRWLNISYRTDRKSPWHTVFSRERGAWLLVRFKDGTVLRGWPRYYSEEPDQKELFLADAVWYVPKTNGIKESLVHLGQFDERPVSDPGILLTDFSNIIAIEVKKTSN